MTRPSTLVVVHTCGAKGVEGAALQRQANLPYWAVLPLPEAAIYPHGSHTESYLYRLARPDSELKPLTEVNGAQLRSLRDIVHKTRKQQGRVHVIGVLDLDSPVGSRRALESLLRQTRGVGLPLVVHAAVWHATPNEQRYALQELQTLLVPGQTELGALFDVHSHAGAPIIARFNQALPSHVVMRPEDSVVIANHDMHGLHAFVDSIRDKYGVFVTSLPHEMPSAPPLLDSLSKHKFVRSAVSRPAYEQAYAGTIQHPYYESLINPSATALLEELVSPHMQTKPHHLYVGVDAEPRANFAPLLRSLLQQQHDRTVVCALVNPHGIDTSFVIANVPLAHDGSLYHHVQQILR